MKLMVQATLLFLALMVTGLVHAESTEYGYVENVTLLPEDLTLAAKLDTGAKTASINATEVKEFTLHGNKWIQFVVTSKNGSKTFKRKLRKYVKIKSRVEELGSETDAKHHYAERPEVLMKIRLGDKEKVILVDLANRKNFNYPLLLGRDAIKKFDGIIDPSQAFTHKQGKQNGDTQGKD